MAIATKRRRHPDFIGTGSATKARRAGLGLADRYRDPGAPGERSVRTASASDANVGRAWPADQYRDPGAPGSRRSAHGARLQPINTSLRVFVGAVDVFVWTPWRTFRGLLTHPLMAAKRQVVLNMTGPMEPMPEPAGSVIPRRAGYREGTVVEHFAPRR